MPDEALQPIQVSLTASQIANLAQFQQDRGIASRDAAIGLLLDIAFEAVSASGRRFWDKPIADGHEPTIQQARQLADRLREQGHDAAADRLHTATAGERFSHALLEGVREACQTVLTTLEALDPKTQLLAEELRLEIDKRLMR